jgi:hypothetical protein
MSVFPGSEQPRSEEEVAPRASDVDLFAHIEGLCGQEAALLAILHHERSEHEHRRLREIEAELDRVWERLRERAERRGRRA